MPLNKENKPILCLLLFLHINSVIDSFIYIILDGDSLSLLILTTVIICV